MKSTRSLLFLARHLEALVRLWQARIELARSSWRAALQRGQKVRASVGRFEGGDEERLRQVERALLRTSRLVYGATCIHRALAARRMLADRGLSAQVVIGLRKREGVLEGHAWIETQGGGGPLRAFCGEGGQYSAIVDPGDAGVDRFAP